MVVFLVPFEGGFFGQMRRTGQQKDVILKNKAGKLLKIKDRGQKQSGACC
jgi:hypothetical protein